MQKCCAIYEGLKASHRIDRIITRKPKAIFCPFCWPIFPSENSSLLTPWITRVAHFHLRKTFEPASVRTTWSISVRCWLPRNLDSAHVCFKLFRLSETTTWSPHDVYFMPQNASSILREVWRLHEICTFTSRRRWENEKIWKPELSTQ